MEDSTEQYIQISQNPGKSSNNISSKISNEVLATAQRKKECEDYAMKIVMFLLDGKLQPEIFLKCLKYINQDYYQDVVEERALSKLCGYPICGKKIPEMPKQKYFISTKVNKVYDISERKNYCSNSCYQGSLFVKEQIDLRPLWLRNYKEIPDCKLMSTTLVCSPGKEMDYGIVKVSPDPPQFTSIIQFTQLSLEEVGKSEKPSKNSKCNINFRKTQKLPLLNVIKENIVDTSESESGKNDYEIEKCNDEIDKIKVLVADAQGNEGCSDTSKIFTKDEKLKHLIAKLKTNNESKTRLIDPVPMKIDNTKHPLVDNNTSKQKKATVKSKEDVVLRNSENIFHSIKEDLLSNIKKSFKEWITLDSFIYLYGEEKIKEILSENKMGQYFDKLNVSSLQVPQKLKYMNICKRLHMQELAEERFHNDTVGHTLKPLPNFKQLKEEVQTLDLKVKSFYKGTLYEQADTNFPTIPVKEKQNIGEESTVLPMVDVLAQNALRRKVFLTSLNKSAKKLIEELGLDESHILLCVQDLVKTFKLQAHNCVFKPNFWLPIALMLIKILSIKYTTIQIHLEEMKSVEYSTLMLSKYAGIEETMEEIYMLFKNVDKFVESEIMNE